MHTKYAIVASTSDKAGMNIASFLQNKHGFEKTQEEFNSNPVYAKEEFQLVFINEIQIYADLVDQIDADFIVFASKHKSESGKPTLTTHAIGNWGKAEMGGRDKTLVPCSAILNKDLILNLCNSAKKANLAWPIASETTHHGPYLSKPTAFIEIGSSEEQWVNRAAGEVVADTIISASSKKAKKYQVAVGVGGPHYCPIFTRILLETDTALGHLLPKYHIDSVDLKLFKQMIDKTVEPVEDVLIDWKGTTQPQRVKIIEYCDKLGLEYQKASNLL